MNYFFPDRPYIGENESIQSSSSHYTLRNAKLYLTYFRLITMHCSATLKQLFWFRLGQTVSQYKLGLPTPPDQFTVTLLTMSLFSALLKKFFQRWYRKLTLSESLRIKLKFLLCNSFFYFLSFFDLIQSRRNNFLIKFLTTCQVETYHVICSGTNLLHSNFSSSYILQPLSARAPSTTADLRRKASYLSTWTSYLGPPEKFLQHFHLEIHKKAQPTVSTTVKFWHSLFKDSFLIVYWQRV